MSQLREGGDRPLDRLVRKCLLARHEGEEQVDVPLHAEKPVVQKQAVAKERIGLQKVVETERQTVQDEVKKEHVDVEGDVA